MSDFEITCVNFILKSNNKTNYICTCAQTNAVMNTYTCTHGHVVRKSSADKDNNEIRSGTQMTHKYREIQVKFHFQVRSVTFSP